MVFRRECSDDGVLREEEDHLHKEFGIILDLTRCGQRLNNRAAILQSKFIPS